MTVITDELPVELPNADDGPCLSLYQPTHRRHPENVQDTIRFKNLVRILERSLRQKYPTREVRPLLEPLDEVGSQFDFWNHAQDGLAILRSPHILRIYRLQRPVAELAIVADSFHTKPLLRIVQSADRYQVLGLSRATVKLYEGNRYALDEIDLAPGAAEAITQVLGEKSSRVRQPAVAHGGSRGARAPIYHGYGTTNDVADIGTEKLFRAVDSSILEHHSRPSGLPLLLAALPEHHGTFRKISRNPFLIEDGIKIDPDSILIDELRELAWQIVEPRYQERLRQLVDEFEQARPRGLVGDHLGEIAFATVSGRVMKLLVEADREIPGHVDPALGRIEFSDLNHPQIDDLLDDLAELVLSKGGEVVVTPSEQMPVATGAAAIYRY